MPAAQSPARASVRPVACELYFLPVQTRMAYGFGKSSLTQVTCARVKLVVEGPDGRRAEGWGETPLSVPWVWPSALSYEEREGALKAFCRRLCAAWAGFAETGHALRVGHAFAEGPLGEAHGAFDAERGGEPMPRLAALVCCSAFDLALHDAFGKLAGVPTYATYTADWMAGGLRAFYPGEGFPDRPPADYLVADPPAAIPVWHSVGSGDPLEEGDLTGNEPDDGYPVLLRDWIRRDGLKCLKIKLTGDDAGWDYRRIVRVGTIGAEEGALWLCTDFNCTVRDPAYVVEMLDRLLREHPRIWQMVLYVEQPFPHDLEAHPIDAHAISARKPLFMDESAHDWRLVKLGRELGYTGVALKTCKTQTGAILSACWARQRGMTLMVQDLTNPMLAMIPHALLAAHAGTIMGLESNAMQYYPEASKPEAAVHPGLYRRRRGTIDLSTLDGPGFGYRLDEIGRALPEPDAAA